jgi:hypothetical protein
MDTVGPLSHGAARPELFDLDAIVPKLLSTDFPESYSAAIRDA